MATRKAISRIDHAIKLQRHPPPPRVKKSGVRMEELSDLLCNWVI